MNLLGNFLCLGVEWLKGAQVEDKIPCFVGFDVVDKRRHGCAIEAGHEDLVNVGVAVAALGTSVLAEIVRVDSSTEVILQSGSRGAVCLAGYAVALPALHA